MLSCLSAIWFDESYSEKEGHTVGWLKSRAELIADVIDKVHPSLVNWGIQPQLRSMKLKSQVYVIITFPGENIKWDEREDLRSGCGCGVIAGTRDFLSV